MVVISDSDQVYSLKKLAVSSHEIKYQLINIFTLIECDYQFYLSLIFQLSKVKASFEVSKFNALTLNSNSEGKRACYVR